MLTPYALRLIEKTSVVQSAKVEPAKPAFPEIKPPITRKDIVRLMGGKISERQLARHEKDWRLDRARLDWGTRQVLYNAAMAKSILGLA